MKRREFIAGLGGAVAWSVGARAQQARMPVVGYLSALSAGDRPTIDEAFRSGLREIGYADGRNVSIEYRWAERNSERLPALAMELVQRPVNLIVASGDTAAVAAKAATPSIPIVYSGANDPVKLGLVASLNRPGGNLTGVANLNVELGPKRVEVVRELLPKATRLALLVNRVGANADEVVRSTQVSAQKIGIELDVLHASTEHELDTAFTSLIRRRADAVVFGADIFFNSRSAYLAALAIRHTVPAIFQTREFAAAGGLMSFGGSVKDAYHQVGVYAGRILKGERPTELPVQQLSKFEMIINLKTAKMLGINVPESLLARADEVIE